MRIQLIGLALLVFAGVSAQAQQSLLQAGPMVGHVEMQTAQLWLQTKQKAEVTVKFWPSTSPKDVTSLSALTTVADNHYIVKPQMVGLKPGTSYDYQVLINGKPCKFDYPTKVTTFPLYQWRADPPTFKVAIGSCYYHPEPEVDRPGKPYGDKLEIFKTIYNQKPDAMVWLGDNVYSREVDFGSKYGFYRRYTMARSAPELQPLLAAGPNYAIWDDHDYGPNDADRSWAGKRWTEEVFNNFWCNPTTNATGDGGITSTVVMNDVQFFLLDDRYHRSPNHDKTARKKSFLGDKQVQWLIDNLIYSKATFKIVCIGGQVLNNVPAHENYANYAEERAQLLDLIRNAGVKGVLFLSGDRHHTELIKLDNQMSYPLYDLTVSPLTSGVAQPGKNETDEATGRVANTLVTERNFGLLEFSGKDKERTMKISIMDYTGKLMWERSIAASELR